MKDNELDDLLREKANNIDDSKFNFKMDVNEIKKQAEDNKVMMAGTYLGSAEQPDGYIFICSYIFASTNHR